MNNTELQFVTFEQAKRLKAAGFDWKGEYCYYTDEQVHRGSVRNHNRENDEWSAPTVALALKWMRDVKGFQCAVINWADCYGIMTVDNRFCLRYYPTYEAAESALLDELLNLIEKKS
jgi:hypothetical protein